VRTSEGKLHLFVAIDRTSKFAYVELHQRATTAISKQFLDNLVAAVPYTIHTVLTDNGIQFTDPTGESWTPIDIRRMRAEESCSGAMPLRVDAPLTTLIIG